MPIPLFDLEAQHAAVREEIDAAIAGVFAHGRFVGGPEIEAFEEAFAAFCGAPHCVGLSNGTDALTLALRAAGVGAGDDVITTSMTFIATVESICLAGAHPVLVDPQRDTALMDVAAVEAAITPDTAAVVVVHLYGQPVDLDAFRVLCDRRGLLLVEDAAQAHGAEWRGRKVGSVGNVATFSFFPGKNLGALGDAGAVTTGDGELSRRIRSFRDHGRSEKYRHDELGTNARLDTLQAAVLTAKLWHLPAWNEARRLRAARYDAALAKLEGVTPLRVLDGALPVYHQYVVRTADRDSARSSLARRGISSGVHYPIPLHRQPALAGLANESAFPNADALANEVLSLPLYPELSPAQQETVATALAQHVGSEARVGTPT
jgi:dTDP-3-amino-3,4,6-trideoxy-alpha-D-glucose transaminase